MQSRIAVSVLYGHIGAARKQFFDSILVITPDVSHQCGAAILAATIRIELGPVQQCFLNFVVHCVDRMAERSEAVLVFDVDINTV